MNAGRFCQHEVHFYQRPVLYICMVIQYLILIVSLFLAAQLSLAQDGFIGDFKAKQVNDNIQISFTINAGNQCSDVEIERSIDSVDFQTLYSLPGICGNASADATYFHSDPSPYKNVTNYYRLKIGFQGFSRIISVQFFAPDKDGYLLISNPDGSATLLFDNNTSAVYNFELFSMDGRLTQFITGITGNHLTVHKNNSAQGIHFFRLKKENEKTITGKLIFN